MARGTRSRRPQRRRRKPKHNWTNKTTRASRQKDYFLDQGKANYFKYDMEKILGDAEVEEDHWGSTIATMFAKGIRTGVDDAKDFARSKFEDDELYDEETLEKILKLLDRYGTYR